LGVIAKGFYRRQLSSLMLDKIKWLPAIIFYAIYSFGILLLVIAPSVEKSSIISAFFTGALLGFVSYATYDLSNLATIKKWPLQVVIADICWGTVLTSIVSPLAFLVAKGIT
jgi:uncharacterized membrane protein